MKILNASLISCLLLTGCALDTEHYRNNSPEFKFESFFNGKLCAKGLVRARNGQVNRKFTAEIMAYSSATQVRLEEVFLFGDGEQQKRDWEFNEIDKGWQGTANDVIGIAQGEIFGDSLHLTYQLKINVENDEYIVAMDDWLHLIDDSTLMGSTEMTKWGVNVGRIDIVIQKDSSISSDNMIQKDKSRVSSCIADLDL